MEALFTCFHGELQHQSSFDDDDGFPHFPMHLTQNEHTRSRLNEFLSSVQKKMKTLSFPFKR